TTRFNLPHGIACSFTLPVLLRFNAQVDDGRLLNVARTVGCQDAADLSRRRERLFGELQVSELFGRHIEDVDSMMALVCEMITPGRADNNMREASTRDIESLLRDALEYIR